MDASNDIKDWLRLSLSIRIRAEAKAILKQFKNPTHLFRVSAKEIIQRGFKQKLADEVQKVKNRDVSKELFLLEKNGIKLISFLDKEYPTNLRSISVPPLILYVWGNFLPQDCFAIAIVGSRLASLYGLKMAERLSRELSYRGFAIISGMARGIDTAAHKGVLKSGGRTIAVLGCGVDIVYPRENRKIKSEIVKQGAVISEFPLGMPPEKFNFPIRNRIIAGLSLGTVVVEAAKYSGALITANCALEQGREVFAVPGQVDSALSQGTHQILKQGAKLVQNADDILEELQPIIKSHLKNLKKRSRSIHFDETEEKGCLVPRLDADEKKIYNTLSKSEAKHIDEISKEITFPLAKVLSILSMLEMKKIVRRLAGQRFVKKE